MNIMGSLSEYVKENAKDYGAHGSDHLLRVWEIAKKIGKNEGVNLKILEGMTLLHDIIRPEDATEKGHANSSAKEAKEILAKFDYDENEIELVVSGILSHSIHSNVNDTPKSIEAKVLFDADKIEAVGSIGISRWFFTTSKKNISLESAALIYLQSVDDYKKNNEKLYTKLGNKLVKDRLAFSIKFMQKLLHDLKEF